jgi:hypothetical protein
VERWLGRHWGVSARAKVEFWKAMVGSVVRYGSEVWWPLAKPGTDLERVQLKFLKGVLRVQRGTKDEFVRGELGCFELERDRNKMMLIWLGRLEVMGDQRWARKVYLHEWRNVTNGAKMKTWKAKVGELIREYGLGEALESLRETGELKVWMKLVKESVEEKAIEVWKDGVRAGSKLGVYLRVKTEWGFEEYCEGPTP